MKKIVSFVLVLTLLLAGCQKPSEEVNQDLPSEPTVEATIADATQEATEEATDAPAIVYKQQEMVAVSMPVEAETVSDDDGNVIFSHKYQNMQLITNDPAVADSIIVDFLNRQDGSRGDIDAISQQAQAEYSGGENWIPYCYDTLYSPTRIDQGVLSLYGANTSYSGGNHAVKICSSANYNMLSGEVLTLGSILYHIDSKETLVELVTQKADKMAESLQLYPDYADYIQQRFNREESFDEDWYFSGSGLCFYFAPYEIAPYSTGIVILEIPYSELTGVISDEFFPPEEDLMEGSLACQLLSEADTAAYTQIAEVTTDAEGEYFLLYAEGAVRNVIIESGSWDETGAVFTPDCTIFATYTLTPGDAVMVQADIPDTASNLRISYRSGDEIHRVFLCQNGEDGAALLRGA